MARTIEAKHGLMTRRTTPVQPYRSVILMFVVICLPWTHAVVSATNGYQVAVGSVSDAGAVVIPPDNTGATSTSKPISMPIIPPAPVPLSASDHIREYVPIQLASSFVDGRIPPPPPPPPPQRHHQQHEHKKKRSAGMAEGQEWSIPVPSVANNIALPLKGFQSLAVVNSSTMLCNGRSDLCDLRFNQVTYPATHNSAAYDLQYDCALATNTCLETQTATEQFCLGWEDICTSSLEVCTLWGSACPGVVPEWALPCLWENQPDHPISKQLNDGIRFLDLGTCATNNNTQLVMCHGFGAQRAIGYSLDSILSQILSFILANPYDVLTIEFNEYDGPASEMSAIIIAKCLQYFTLPDGHQLFYSRGGLSDPWPTLRNMILDNQRLMIFMSDMYYSIPEPKPAWLYMKDWWKQDGFQYTSRDTKPEQLNASYHKWCDQGPTNDGSYVRWQQIDINLGILPEDIIATLKQGKVPEICIEPLSEETNGALMSNLADYCYSRWPYWFRVRVNNYWHGNVFQVANLFNDRNVARVRSGDPLTPY
ncbi:hypothetical protein BG004_006231 [Podila humilis]|nr:hypothetical protein BG004_006231 [Podila humilis]